MSRKQQTAQRQKSSDQSHHGTPTKGIQTRAFATDNPSSTSLADKNPGDRPPQLNYDISKHLTKTSIQAKLTVGAVGDKYEQEADAVAANVVAQIHSPNTQKSEEVQRQEEDEELQMKPDLQKQEDEEELQAKPDLQRQEDEEELQMKPTPQRVSTEGGTVTEDIESTIEQARGNGQTLTPKLQTQMGESMGADFSNVRIHTDSQADQLNRSIGARAFTTGKDLFFKKGEYQPENRKGQELIAHELTHVVQQGGAAIQAKPASRTPKHHPNPLAISQAKTPIVVQRKDALIRDKAHTRVLSAEPTGTEQQIDKLINKGTQGDLFTKGGIVDLDADPTKHIKQGTQISWYRVNKPGFIYIRATKVISLESSDVTNEFDTTNTETSDGTRKNLEGSNEALLGTSSGSLEKFSKTAKASNSEADTSKLDTGKGSMDTASGILGMATSIATLFSGKAELTDKIAALFDGFASGAKTVSGISGIVEATNGASDSDAGKVSNWSGAFGNMISTLKSGVDSMINVVDLIKMISSDENYSKQEYFEKGSKLLLNALATAKGVMESIKGVYEAIGGLATGVLEKAVVGIDIAISACKTLMQGFYLAESAYQWYLMSKREKEEKANLENKGQDADKIKAAQDFYTTTEAQIAVLKARIAEKEAKNLLRQQQLNTMPAGKAKTKLQNQYDTTQAKITRHTNEVTALNQQISNREDPSTGNLTRQDLAGLDLTQELGSGNRKRVIRQSIHIFTNLLNIAGGIANLTGVGAQAGVALKASAAGIDLSLPLFRSLKEFGRNQAAKNRAKGESGIANKIFNADKATVAKLTSRKKHAAVIMSMVADLNTILPKSSDPVEKAKETQALNTAIQRIEGYIRATGCSPKKLYRLNGQPMQQLELLVQEMYKREFI